MNKITLSMLLAATLVSAADYNYEVSPMAGYDWSSGQKLNNYDVYGAEVQYNGLDSVIKPELSLFFGQANYTHYRPHQTDVWRTAINGVYEFSKTSRVTPFVKMGAGYESINDKGNTPSAAYPNRNKNYDGVFVDAGVGIKVALMDQLALKLEAMDIGKRQQGSDWDNNILLLAGLNFAFGEKAQPVAPVVVAPVVAKPVPAVVTPKPAPVVVAPVVAAPVVVAVIDGDKDGVLDNVDKCLSTPTGFKVDADGCPIKATLHLNYATNSNKIDAKGITEVNAFADFLKASPSYKVSIVGHTDSVGSAKSNQQLSEKRASAVKAMLVKDGVDANRLTTTGKGESVPVASNKTKEGRAENRRIEAELSN